MFFEIKKWNRLAESDIAIILNAVFKRLDLNVPKATTEQFDILKRSVNLTRLKNHPIALSMETIDMVYHMVLR